MKLVINIHPRLVARSFSLELGHYVYRKKKLHLKTRIYKHDGC